MIDHKKLPATVREVASMLGCSKSSVCRYIAAGHLKAERRKNKSGRASIIYVTGGDVPVTRREWEARLSPVISPALPAGSWGFDASSNLQILRECKVCILPFDDRASRLRDLIQGGGKPHRDARSPCVG